MLTVLSSVLLMLSTVLGRGSPLSGVRRCDCVWLSKRMQGIYMWLSILPDVAARTKALSRDSNQKEGRACSTPSAFCFSRSSASHDLRPTSRSDQVSRARRACCGPAQGAFIQCSFQQSHVPARPPHRTISCAGRPCERCRPQIQLRPDVKLGRQGEGVAPSSRVDDW